MLFKEKLLYSYWLKLYGKFRKPERFGIGEKMDSLFLEILECTHQNRYAPMALKLPYLEKAILKIDRLKFFSEIAWENKLMTAREHSDVLLKLEEIGRELGGWKKGIVNKNSRS